MKIDIRFKGIDEAGELTEHVERHVRFGLARFGSRVRHVHVQVIDVNGPRGGLDIQCKMRAELVNAPGIIVREVHRDPFAAVARAADRVSHSVSRRIGRFTTARRRGITRLGGRPWRSRREIPALAELG